MKDFMDLIRGKGGLSKSSIDQSVESHIMAYAAEESRISGTTLDLDELKEKLLQDNRTNKKVW